MLQFEQWRQAEARKEQLQAEEQNQRRNAEEEEARQLDPETIERIRQNRERAMQIRARASEMVAGGSASGGPSGA